MIINVKMDDGAKMPTKAHDMDAGFDLYTPVDFAVFPHDNSVIDTGVHMAIPQGYAGVLISKSGLNVKRDLTSTGLIDAGYTGSIAVKLYNHGDDRQFFKAGDKISQIVIVPIESPVLHLDEDLKETERGSKGFGSSGR